MYVREPLPHSRPFVFHVLFVIIVLVGFLPFSTASAFEGSGEPPHIFMEGWPTGEADEPRQIIVHREGGFFALRSASFPMRILASQSFRQGKTDVITTLVEVDDDVDLAAAIQEIEAQPGVLYAEPNYPVYLFAAPYPNDYYFSDQWGMAPYDGEYAFGVSAPGAWALYEKSDKKRDDPVIVAVIDSGVDVNHPDLQNRVTNYGVQIIGGEISTKREDYSLDLSGHGTHVAGIIAAETNNDIDIAGVAGEANVKILPVKTFSLTTGTLFDIAAGIRWAVDNGADVLNLSFGSLMLTQTQADAIQYAIDNGVIVVAAAGNNRSRVDRVYPAAYPGVITVAAIEDDGAIGSFSNYGPQIDLAAPGVNILSTIPSGGYADHTGTSMATPFVAGAAALLLAADKTLTPQAVYQRLIDHAVDLGPAGHDPDFGYGLLNVEVALRDAMAAEPVITLTSPFPGTTIVGTTTVTAQLAQPDQVSRVAFYLDDEDNLIRAITDEITGSLSFSWTPHVDSPGLPDGSYTLYAAAYDEEGKPLGSDSVDIEIQREEQSGLLLHIEPPSSDGTPGRAVAAQVTVYDVKRHNGQPIEKMKVASDKTDMEGDLYLPDLPMGKEYLIVANGTIIRNASDGNDQGDGKGQAEEWFFYTRTIDTADPAQRGRLTIDGEHALAVIPRVIKDDEEFIPSSGQLWIVKDDDDITFAATGSRWDPNLDTGKMKFWVDPGTYTFILAGNEQGDAYFLTAPDRQVTANNTNVRFEAGNSIEMKVPDQHFVERLRVTIEEKDTWDYVTTSTYCVICEIDLQERLYLAPGEYDVSFQIIYETDENNRWTYTLHPVDGQGERVPWHVTPALDSVAFDGEYTASFAMAPGYPKGESFHFDVLITTTHEGQSYRIAQMSHRDLSAATDVSIRRVVPGSQELEDVENPFRSMVARADAVTGVFDTSKVLEGTYVPYLKIPLGPLGGNKVLDAEGPAFDVTQSGDRALSRIEVVAPIDVWDSLPELRLYEVIDGEFQLVHTGFGFNFNDPDV
ncbi:MAG TPA: S8 family serine peptidase, partial [Sphingobacteriaceae bacterium]|nr:S8 family serine peptidase [Sphingobacteriaceae bacterium]